MRYKIQYPRISRSIQSGIFALLVAAILCFCIGQVHSQTTVSIAPLMHLQFLDSTGKVLAGGFLYTYSAGTTTRLDTYTDSTGTIANAWPIPLDATGAPSNGSTQTGVWLSNSAYKFCAFNSALVQQWCADNVSGWLGLTNLAQTWNGVQTFAQPTNFTQSDNQLVFNSSSGAPVTLDIPPSNTGGPITIHFPNVAGTLASGGAVGTVTSVAMTVPSQFAIAGSPITAAGTLALTMPGATGSGNVVLAASPALTTPTISSPTINSGIAHGGTGLQHVRVTGCNTSPNPCTGTITWPSSFADTSYTAVCTNVMSTAEAEVLVILVKSAGSMTYQKESAGGSGNDGAGEIDCIGIHD